MTFRPLGLLLANNFARKDWKSEINNGLRLEILIARVRFTMGCLI